MPATPDLPHLRRLLLGLIAPGTSAASLGGLDEAAIGALDAMAAQHRLQPLLHHLHGAGDLPPVLAESWRQAHRFSQLSAMVHKVELTAVCALLEGAGHAPIALKGAWLAWHAYPEAALRPVRDIDLLLTPEDVIAAFDLLCAQGYQTGPAELSPQDVLRLDKHMPPLLSPRGVTIELHHRLWEVDGRMDHHAPASIGSDPRSRMIMREGLRYLAPADTLAHLIVHAVYDHRLDCGPLLLWDIACLLRASPVDWQAFWQGAEAGGWAKGARLVLDLVAAHDPGIAIAFPPGLAATPAAILNSAPDLLLQPLESRQSAGVIATARAAGPLRFFQRLGARRSAAGDAGAVVRDLAAEGGYLGWAGSRLRRTLGQLVSGEVRRQSSGLARLSQWLDG